MTKTKAQVKAEIDAGIYENNRRAITPTVLNGVLTSMLDLQDQNDTEHDTHIELLAGQISELSDIEPLTNIELENLLQ